MEREEDKVILERKMVRLSFTIVEQMVYVMI